MGKGENAQKRGQLLFLLHWGCFFFHLGHKHRREHRRHDIVNTSKAAAYSGMLMFFPAVLVLTTLVSQVEEGPTMVGETRAVLEQFLPPDTLDLVQSSVLAHHHRSTQVVLSATGLSLFAGLGVMLSLMEGFRRAYHLPPEDWTFWGRRARALLLVPIALVPLAVASLVIVFGHEIERWMIDNRATICATLSSSSGAWSAGP